MEPPIPNEILEYQAGMLEQTLYLPDTMMPNDY
jgi:hypothetical protein